MPRSALRALPLLGFATALTVSACSSSPGGLRGSTSEGASAALPDYLALGDSVAFGENPNDLSDPVMTHFVGYPDELAPLVGLSVTNAGCAGEASGGFLDPSGADNGCALNKALGRLHVQYSSTQMDFALGFLANHPFTQLVTLDIGANDLFLMQKASQDSCGFFSGVCEVALGPDTLEDFHENLGTILTNITNVYPGELVVMTYYAPDYRNLFNRGAIDLLNGIITSTGQSHGATVVDVGAVFKDRANRVGGDTCATGLLIKLPDGTCDVHPSPAGRKLIAQTIASALGH